MLVNGFGQKNENFPFFSFGNNCLRKCVSRYSRKESAFLERKKAVLNYKNKKLTIEKIGFFQKGLSIW